MGKVPDELPEVSFQLISFIAEARGRLLKRVCSTVAATSLRIALILEPACVQKKANKIIISFLLQMLGLVQF